MFRIKFEVEPWDVDYFKRDAEECMKEAREYEVPTTDFGFTVEEEDGKWIVTMYENGTEVELKNGWISFDGGILNGYTVNYSDTKNGITTQWID